MRISRYLASCGLGSRRKCEELVNAGRVKVNGEIIDTPAFDINPKTDEIFFDDAPAVPQKKVYYLLNKPTGYTSTLADVHAEKLVTELVPDTEFVWPVGRLDRDTCGLIILTNDGELTQHLTHPKYEKSKTYIASIDKPLATNQLVELEHGILLEDGPIKPDEIKALAANQYQITIHEGRNRLVRRTFEHFGRKVLSLERTRLSFLEMDNLKTGEFRPLSEQEVERLKNA